MFNKNSFQELPSAHLENQELAEVKTADPSIMLSFFRHDDKELSIRDGAPIPDEDVRLTQEGRIHATETGKEKNPHSEVGLAYGSPRKRAQETAHRQMLAAEPSITQEDSLEDIEEKIAESMLRAGEKVGKKIIITDKLDFTMNGSDEFRAKGEGAYKTKKYLEFLFNDSDELAQKANDAISTSYSRSAANVAELVQRYVNILPQWVKIVEKEPTGSRKKTDYAQYNNELQRFLGSHQSVTECFLMKIIEKTEGREAVEKFIASLPTKNGFDFSHGFTVILKQDEMKVVYNEKEWTIKPEMIEEIINERAELDEKINQSKNAPH